MKKFAMYWEKLPELAQVGISLLIGVALSFVFCRQALKGGKKMR